MRNPSPQFQNGYVAPDSFWTVHDSRRQFGVLGTVERFYVIDAHLGVRIRQANPTELENSGHLGDGKGYIAFPLLSLIWSVSIR
jgi:hypothetical protein